MFKRELVSQLIERLTEPHRFIQIVVGPRQTVYVNLKTSQRMAEI